MPQEIKTVIPGGIVYAPHPDKPEVPVFVSLYGMMPWTPSFMADLTKWCGKLETRTSFAHIQECKALFYAPYDSGRVSGEAMAAQDFFFRRDKSQALVFEWDKIRNIFVWRDAEYFLFPGRAA